VHARGRARSFALTPFIPLARLAGEGETQGALPCAPTPLAYRVGEGLGVRATKSVYPSPTVNPTDVPIYRSPHQSSQKTADDDPLLQVPPASMGNRRAWFPSRSGGNLKEGGIVDFDCAVDIISHVGERCRGERLFAQP